MSEELMGYYEAELLEDANAEAKAAVEADLDPENEGAEG